MMNGSDELLATRFAATRDELEDSDWGDVKRRLSGRQRRRPRMLLLAAVIATVAVPAGLAVSGTIRDVFFGTPAPDPVRAALDQSNATRRAWANWAKEHGLTPPPFGPTVDSSRAYGVIALTTTDGPLALWVAPSKNGNRQCWLVAFASDKAAHGQIANGQTTCELTRQPLDNISFAYTWSHSHPDLKLLSGKVYADATTITVHFQDRNPAQLQLTDHFFLATFPRTTKAPIRIDATNKNGDTVATWQR